MLKHPTVSFRHRFAGWVLLGIYLVITLGLMPVAVQAVAALHGSHEVSVTAAHGDWNVVLRHCGDAGSDAAEHCPHSQPVAADDEADHHHGPDHVFHFSAAQHAIAPAVCEVPGGVLSSLSPERIFVQEPAPCLLLECLETVSARPPPGRPALLVCLRTTVLIV